MLLREIKLCTVSIQVDEMFDVSILRDDKKNLIAY